MKQFTIYPGYQPDPAVSKKPNQQEYFEEIVAESINYCRLEAAGERLDPAGGGALKSRTGAK